jgi:energy-coupling factor transporter ATP-binding protein EcfA2
MRTTLSSVQTTAGFLEHCRVEFAPGLTCIIGARGTCKSTLVESIRFAFDHDPKRVEVLTSDGSSAGDSFRGMLATTLRAGSVRCEVLQGEGAETQRLVIERELGAAPRVFVNDVREHAPINLRHAIEIYSQGDLQRIADESNDDARLGLIDRAHAVEAHQIAEKRRPLVERLVQIGPKLRTLRANTATLAQQTQVMPTLRDQLKTIQATSPALPPALETERARYEARQRVLAALTEVRKLQHEAAEPLAMLDSLRQKAQTFTAAVAAETDVPTATVAIALDAVASAFRALETAGTRLGAVDLAGAHQALSRQYEEASEAYYRLRQDQQVHNESLKQQELLLRQLRDVEARQQELVKVQEQEAAVLRERRLLRTEISALDNRLYDLRVAEIDAINAEHGADDDVHSGMVHLALRTGAAGSPGAVKKLQELLAGSRIRQQDEVARAVAEAFAPADLIDIVESGSGQALTDAIQRDLGQMNRVVAYLADHADLYTLEAEPPAARLEITFYDKGEPKKVEALSKGQRATALLPLILRPLPYPLVIDQPEDDLDNFFIFETLVRTIQRLKMQRQLIFVTHNANIPVLGDADRIIVMRMRSPVAADAPRVGTVEERKQDVLDLLEGGAAAFIHREARYHELLTSVEIS